MEPVKDSYSIERHSEHSTLGDSYERMERDPDAFAAGAQYALDRILSSTADTLNLFGEGVERMVVSRAAEILSRIHRGEL